MIVKSSWGGNGLMLSEKSDREYDALCLRHTDIIPHSPEDIILKDGKATSHLYNNHDRQGGLLWAQ